LLVGIHQQNGNEALAREEVPLEQGNVEVATLEIAGNFLFDTATHRDFWARWELELSAIKLATSSCWGNGEQSSCQSWWNFWR